MSSSPPGAAVRAAISGRISSRATSNPLSRPTATTRSISSDCAVSRSASSAAAHLPQINKGRGSATQGFFHGWSTLTDAERWALAAYLDDMLAPPPHETVLRALRSDGLDIRFRHSVAAAAREDDAVVLALDTPEGRIERRHDFLVVATGFQVDVADIPELSEIAPHVARWSDRYA